MRKRERERERERENARCTVHNANGSRTSEKSVMKRSMASIDSLDIIFQSGINNFIFNLTKCYIHI